MLLGLFAKKIGFLKVSRNPRFFWVIVLVEAAAVQDTGSDSTQPTLKMPYHKWNFYMIHFRSFT